MQRRIPGWPLIALAVVPGCAQERMGLNRGDELPVEFSMEEIARACVPSDLRAGNDPARDTAVLAWSTCLYYREDGPPLEVWNCLAWQECTDGDGGNRWILKTLFRHPQYEDVWTWAASSHFAQEGLREFTAPPTLDEVYDFLHAAWWDLEPPSYFDDVADDPPDEILGSAFCARAWERTVGRLPSLPIPPEAPAVREARRRGFLGF